MFVATVIACIIFAGYILYSVGKKYLGYNPHSKRAKAYLREMDLTDEEIEAMR